MAKFCSLRSGKKGTVSSEGRDWEEGGRRKNLLQNRLLQLRNLLLLVDLGAVSPEGDHRVSSSRDDRLLVLTDGESPDLVFVVVERSDALLVLDVPEFDESVRR